MSQPIVLRDSVEHAPGTWSEALAGGAVIDAAGCRRFPTALVAAVMAGGHRPEVRGLDPAVAAALRVVGAATAFGLEPITASRLPFAATVQADGTVVLTVSPSAPTVPVTATPVAHDWAAHLRMPALEADLGSLATLNSVVIAWLLQLGHSANPAPMRLVGANRMVVAQLRQLKLDQVLALA
ncbi:MAG: hypothetical protein RLZZ127_274 [Planctomycetota bacterium]